MIGCVSWPLLCALLQLLLAGLRCLSDRTAACCCTHLYSSKRAMNPAYVCLCLSLHDAWCLRTCLHACVCTPAGGQHKSQKTGRVGLLCAPTVQQYLSSHTGLARDGSSPITWFSHGTSHGITSDPWGVQWGSYLSHGVSHGPWGHICPMGCLMGLIFVPWDVPWDHI